MTACKTGSQMYPIIPATQALFAPIGTGDASKNLIKMGTNLCHNFSSREMDLVFGGFNCKQAATFPWNWINWFTGQLRMDRRKAGTITQGKFSLLGWTLHKAINPTHGSGRIVQVLSKTLSLNRFLIPPTEVGVFFKSKLFTEQSANFRWRDLTRLCKLFE